jgi:hypothetical protein
LFVIIGGTFFLVRCLRQRGPKAIPTPGEAEMSDAEHSPYIPYEDNRVYPANNNYMPGNRVSNDPYTMSRYSYQN